MAEWIQTDDPRRLTTEEAGIATFMTAPVPGSEIGGDGGIRTPDRVIMIHLSCIFTTFDPVLYTHINHLIKTFYGDSLFDLFPCCLMKIDVQC